MSSHAKATAEALCEALPHVQRWAGRTVVVKYGGSAMVSDELSDAVMQDVVLLSAVGVRVVLVHGGGNAVSEMGRRLGLEAVFVDGLRVTDEPTMRVAQQVQVGGISRDIVAAMARRGGRAVGLSGHDGGGWLRARRRQHISRETGAEVDLGRVGDVTAVDTRLLLGLLGMGIIPVVAPVAVDDEQASLNVNADSVANAVAEALRADRLLFLTDVAGIRGPAGEVAAVATVSELRAWISSGAISGGMIPKAEACFSAIEAGVGGVTVADGRVPHAVLIELLTDAGVGTMVVPDPVAAGSAAQDLP
jgi:acetylglutamate kinase